MAANDKVLFMSERLHQTLAGSREVLEEAKSTRTPERTIDVSTESTRPSNLQHIEVSNIRVSPFQTRKTFDEPELEELSKSILNKGILQPVIVRKSTSLEAHEQYELIAGERRLRAAKLAGLTEIPALVEDIDDREALEIAIIENAQREDLNPIEEAEAYGRLSTEFGTSQTDIARTIGKNRATVSNSLRLLQLHPEVVDLIRNGDLSAGHGKALLMAESPEKQLSLAHRALRNGLSVREVERIVAYSNSNTGEADEPDEDAVRDRESLDRYSNKISEALGTKAALSRSPQGFRRLQLTFESEASWKRFMSKIRD